MKDKNVTICRYFSPERVNGSHFRCFAFTSSHTPPTVLTAACCRANADIWALGMVPLSLSLLPISFTNACVQVLFECWMGRYPFLQPGQELRDLDEEDVRTSSYCNITHRRLSMFAGAGVHRRRQRAQRSISRVIRHAHGRSDETLPAAMPG